MCNVNCADMHDDADNVDNSAPKTFEKDEALNADTDINNNGAQDFWKEMTWKSVIMRTESIRSQD